MSRETARLSSADARPAAAVNSLHTPGNDTVRNQLHVDRDSGKNQHTLENDFVPNRVHITHESDQTQNVHSRPPPMVSFAMEGDQPGFVHRENVLPYDPSIDFSLPPPLSYSHQPNLPANGQSMMPAHSINPVHLPGVYGGNLLSVAAASLRPMPVGAPTGYSRDFGGLPLPTSTAADDVHPDRSGGFSRFSVPADSCGDDVRHPSLPSVADLRANTQINDSVNRRLLDLGLSENLMNADFEHTHRSRGKKSGLSRTVEDT